MRNLYVPESLGPELFSILPEEKFSPFFHFVDSLNGADLILGSESETQNFCVSVPSEKHWAPQVFSFESPVFAHRVKSAANAREPLRNVLKFRGKTVNCKILDATMGFGVDAFLMALWGHRVHSFERNPLVYACTFRAWKHYCERHPDEAKKMEWTLEFGEAKGGSEVAFLDPMYPEAENRKSLSKKDLRVLSRVISEEPLSIEKIETWIRQLATEVEKKIVLKRPSLCPPAASPPGWIHRRQVGVSTHFDVYTRT